MARIGLVLASFAAILALGACSSAKKASPPATTTSASSSSTTISTTIATSSSSSASTASSTLPTTTTAPGPVTTVRPDGPTISGFVVSPASPVACNSPTMVELAWTATGATSVTLAIDGVPAATYGGGHQDHLQYFACDGKAHTYLLTASAGTAKTTANKVITSKAA